MPQHRYDSALVTDQVRDLMAQNEQLMKKAADDAQRAQLAFATGNWDAYVADQQRQVAERLNAAYDALNGPRSQSDVSGTGTG